MKSGNFDHELIIESAHLQPVLITGGSGFIGTNLADRLLSAGDRVILLDNLSRPGVKRNFEWLQRKHGKLVQLEIGDIRNAKAVERSIGRAGAVFHFAAQVAVTTSLFDPRFDFEVNAMGTLNVLEALRSLPARIPLIFTSTNKVYGSLKDITLMEDNDRYEPKNENLRSNGIGENRGLEFYSPYGCSKGTADQYVLDFARLFGLPALVFRMSCIYGPHQFGTEDQGWVAHFLLQATGGQPITIFGDGKQVRDILFVEDLVDALLLAREHINDLSGEAFNIGGGTGRTISLLELISLIASLNGVAPRVAFEDWRPGDQRYYATNFSKFHAATGWTPGTSVEQGIGGLYAWLQGSGGRQRLAAIS